MFSFISLTLTSRTILNNGETEHPFLVTDFNGIVYSISILSKILLVFIMVTDYQGTSLAVRWLRLRAPKEKNK